MSCIFLKMIFSLYSCVCILFLFFAPSCSSSQGLTPLHLKCWCFSGIILDHFLSLEVQIHLSICLLDHSSLFHRHLKFNIFFSSQSAIPLLPSMNVDITCLIVRVIPLLPSMNVDITCLIVRVRNFGVIILFACVCVWCWESNPGLDVFYHWAASSALVIDSYFYFFFILLTPFPISQLV
jgi:hypothetical protein